MVVAMRNGLDGGLASSVLSSISWPAECCMKQMTEGEVGRRYDAEDTVQGNDASRSSQACPTSSMLRHHRMGGAQLPARRDW